MTPRKISPVPGLELSRIVHGHMRLSEWGLNPQELLTLIEQLIEIGVTTFDHADIYGDYGCEEIFGDALRLKPWLSDQIQLVSKCGIKLLSNKFPDRKIKYYDYSYEYIVSSAESSVRKLGVETLDLFLLHRPAPLFDYEAVARAFGDLKAKGLVQYFGVSNFSAEQFARLQNYLGFELATNQIEISPYHLEHFENGNLDYCVSEMINPMAWSPLAGGNILSPENERGARILNEIKRVADELELEDLSTVIYAWLLAHPAGIIPIVGSGKFQRIRSATLALDIDLSLEQWYRIYCASTGVELP